MIRTLRDELEGIEDNCEIVIQNAVVGYGRCRLLIVHGDMDIRSSTESDMPKRISGRAGRLKIMDSYIESARLNDTYIDLRLASGAILKEALLSRYNTYVDDFVIYGGVYTE